MGITERKVVERKERQAQPSSEKKMKMASRKPHQKKKINLIRIPTATSCDASKRSSHLNAYAYYHWRLLLPAMPEAIKEVRRMPSSLAR